MRKSAESGMDVAEWHLVMGSKKQKIGKTGKGTSLNTP
jgi:hypothetical protein